MNVPNSRAPSRQKLSFNKNTSLSAHVPATVVRRTSHDPLVAGLVLQVGDRVHVVRLLGDQCLQVELGFVHLGLSLQFLLLLLLPRNLQLLAPIMPLDLIVPPLLVEVLHGAAGLGGEEGRPEVRAAEEGHASAEELHEHGPAPCGHRKARGQGARRQTSLLGVAVEEPRLHRPVEVQQLAAAAASDDEGRDLALLGEVPAEDPQAAAVKSDLPQVGHLPRGHRVSAQAVAIPVLAQLHEVAVQSQQPRRLGHAAHPERPPGLPVQEQPILDLAGDVLPAPGRGIDDHDPAVRDA
mmetsp:Transcript_105533/g.283736  ORF Transcript_105533/g.283736 Transcript_105533/m.283736 type:complete len:295 (+) Transcript_105533:360-1244(+)